MSVFQLNVEDASLPRFSRTYDLDGNVYALQFVWLPRFGEWRIRLLDQEELNQLGEDALQLGKPMFHRQLPGFIEVESSVPLAGEMSDLTKVAIYYTDAEGRRAIRDAVNG